MTLAMTAANNPPADTSLTAAGVMETPSIIGMAFQGGDPTGVWPTVGDINVRNITANKITAGTITATINIGGPNIVLEGSVPDIRINDGTVDRIILGKIGADYTIQIKNAAGTVMWDPTTGVTSAGITNATITGTDIAAATISGSNIASATITGSNIASGTIAASNIINATITATQIANATITATQIASGTITATQIAALTITASEIAALTITGAKIAALTITDSKINDVTIDKLTTGNLTATGTITSGKLITAASPNARIELDSLGLHGYNSLNIKVFDLDTNGGNAQLVIERQDAMDPIELYSASSTNGGSLLFKRARGSLSSPAAAQNLTVLGQIAVQGYDGSTFQPESGYLQFVATQTFTATARGTELQAWTTTNGSATASERARITNDGLLEMIQDTGDGLSGTIQLQDKSSGISPGGASASARVYFRNKKLVFSYNDAGTVRYKYLDLTGTGVTWVHTTTAP